jgi:hypothetical protein
VAACVEVSGELRLPASYWRRALANTVASQTILDGNRTAIQKFTFLCDGSGDESAVLKVDVSTLLPNEFGKACNGVTILKIYGSTHGVNVEILWMQRQIYSAQAFQPTPFITWIFLLLAAFQTMLAQAKQVT